MHVPRCSTVVLLAKHGETLEYTKHNSVAEAFRFGRIAAVLYDIRNDRHAQARAITMSR